MGSLILLSFLTRYDEKKVQKNVLALMLNLRFKSSKLIFYFIGHEQRMTIVEKYDRRSMFPMFLKFYPMLCGYIFFDIS